MGKAQTKEIIDDIFRWYSIPRMPEKGMECFLWVEVFKRTLGYSAARVIYQNESSKCNSNNGNIPDLILRPTLKTNIPVEVKIPKILEGSFRNGRSQVAKYAKQKSSKYAVLTDGVRWEIISVNQRMNKYKVIWRHKLEKGSSLSASFLYSLRPSMILRFCDFAESTFGTIGYKKISEFIFKNAGTNMSFQKFLSTNKVPKSDVMTKLLLDQSAIYINHKVSDRPNENWETIE